MLLRNALLARGSCGLKVHGAGTPWNNQPDDIVSSVKRFDTVSLMDGLFTGMLGISSYEEVRNELS